LPAFKINVGTPLGLPPGEAILDLRDVGFRLLDGDDEYPGAPRRGPCLEGVSVSLSMGSRVAIKGRNGSGKSLLLGLVAGQLPPSAGEVWRTPGLTTGYLEQGHVDWMLRQTLTPSQYLRSAVRMSEGRIAEMVAAFGLVEDLLHRRLEALSSGQCMRLALARLAALEPHILVLDEPTSFLDIYSIASLEKSIRDFAGAVVFATHDRQLVEGIATDVLELRGAEGLVLERRQASSVPQNTGKRDRLWREPEAPS